MNAKNIVNLAIIPAILFSCLFFQIILMMNVDKLERREITDLPDNFPIMVVAGNKAQIVFGGELEEFKQTHPDYTFLVPAERYELFREQIHSNTRARLGLTSDESNLPWDAFFEATMLDSHRQSFVVYATWDDDRENTGEYIATEKEISPKFHKVYFGPGKVFLTIAIAILLTAGFWGMLGIIIWYLRRKKRDDV